MNILTKRVPRDPDLRQIEIGETTLLALGVRGEPEDLRRIAVSIYQGMVSRAPDDPMETALEAIYTERRGETA